MEHSLDMSRTTSWFLPFALPLLSSASSVTHIIILRRVFQKNCLISLLHEIKSLSDNAERGGGEAYLSLTKLAFAKQRRADLTRTIRTPGLVIAMGYWSTSQNILVPGSLPRVSMPGLIALSMIFANDIVNCNSNMFRISAYYHN